MVVVVSAMAGETDRLDKLTKDIADIPNEREYDQVISTGEKVSAGLVTIALSGIGVKAISLPDPGDLVIFWSPKSRGARLSHF